MGEYKRVVCGIKKPDRTLLHSPFLMKTGDLLKKIYNSESSRSI